MEFYNSHAYHAYVFATNIGSNIYDFYKVYKALIIFFVSSFPHVPFIYFSCHSSLARISIVMVNRSDSKTILIDP